MKQQNSVQHDNKQLIDAKDLIRKCISDVTQELKDVLHIKMALNGKFVKLQVIMDAIHMEEMLYTLHNT